MRPLALKWRASLLVAAAIMVAMGFTALTAYVEMKESLMHSMDRTLETMAVSALAVLAHSPASSTGDGVKKTVGTPMRHRGTAYRIWFDGDPGNLLSGAWHPDLVSSASLSGVEPPPVGGFAFFDRGRRGDEYRAVWARAAARRGTANVAIAISSHPAYDALEDFQSRLAYATGAVMLITIGATTWLVGVGLRPIARTARALGAVTESNVSNASIEVGATPQELEPFAGAVTAMLARLARALQEQKQFVSDASHELRTPLSVARSTIEAALVKGRRADGYRRALEEVHEDLDRMGRLVEELLVMARLDETAGASQAEAFDLAELVEETAGPYEVRAADQGGRLTLDLKPVTVKGDRAQVGRLLSNLLDNALRYGPEGGTVRLSVEVPRMGMAQVRVHDEGGTIPPEALPHLFERFYRAEQSRARATGGVGLGLSIAREIALRHGGDISVTSNSLEGTIFTVRLPTFLGITESVG